MYRCLKKMYPALILIGQLFLCQILLFCTIVSTCKFYLILHQTILVNWKQSYRSFSEELNFFQLKNSMKFSLSKVCILCFVSMKLLHSPCVSSPEIVLLSMYLWITKLEQTTLCTCLFHFFYLY